MAAKQTIRVPHLGGLEIGYQLSTPSSPTSNSTTTPTPNRPDPSKPTCILINSMCTTSSLFRDQFASPRLTSAMNLLAIEPLGHGASGLPDDGKDGKQHFTYWDTAIAALQVMDEMGVEKAFALGTSHGGWMVVRMGLLAPERILGLLPLGTSMDYESTASRTQHSAWDPKTVLMPFYQNWSSPLSPADEKSFVVDDVWCGMVATLGFGAKGTPENTAFWTETLKQVYRGAEGRRKLRMALCCLLERDGLVLRVGDVRCPVYWLHGKEDSVFPPAVALEHIKLFTSSKDKKVQVLEGGGHYLNATNPQEVEDAMLDMVAKYSK